MARFANLNLEDISKIIHGKDSKNTHKSTDMAYNVFKQYCAEKNIDLDISNKQELEIILCRFYVEARIFIRYSG